MQNIYLISTSLISLTLKIEGNLEVPIDELMQKICHQQLTNKEIILQEYQIIYKLDFKYIYTTVYDILLFHLQQVFIGIEEQNFNQILKLSAFALSKRIQSEEFYVNNIYVNVAGSITSAYVFHTQIQKLQKQIDKQELQNRILKSMRLKKETVKKTLKKETKICFKILQNNYNKKTEQNILKKILSLQVNLYFQN